MDSPPLLDILCECGHGEDVHTLLDWGDVPDDKRRLCLSGLVDHGLRCDCEDFRATDATIPA